MKHRPVVPYLILTAVVLAAMWLVPRFSHPLNLGNVLTQSVPLILTAAGQTLVLIAGGIDMSVGEVVTLTTVLASSLMHAEPYSIVVAVAAALAAGALVGVLNGLGVARVGLQPFMITVAMMFALQGVNLYLRPVPGGFVPPEFRLLATTRFGIVPLGVLITVTLIVGMAIHLRRSRMGLHLYATGSNPARAHLLGVPSTRVTVWAYTLSAILAVLAGLFLAARTGTGDRFIGSLYAFDSITAAILGGASLSGGKGTLWGALAAAVLLGVISNVLNLLHVVAYWQWIIKGVLLMLAVAIATLWEVRANGEKTSLRAHQGVSGRVD